MAISVINIWNLALSAVGSRGSVSSETEIGREADLCRLWYPLVRDSVLKSASWPSAKTYARLAVLAERDAAVDWVITDPAPTWRFVYAAPIDMLAPRNLASYARFSTGLWDSRRVILADEEDAILHYISQQIDVSLWDAGLTTAIAYSLAAALALPLTGKSTLAEKLRDRATEAVLLAQTEIANESDENYAQLPSWVAARGFSPLPIGSRFVWPYESFSAIGA